MSKMVDASIYFRNEKTTDVWLTPPEIVKALGHFDMDPCSPIEAPWRLAPLYYTIEHDGLMCPWIGRVFVNPPYGSETKKWMKKIANYKNGIALVFARIETNWFQEYVWKKADAVLFFDSRISFFNSEGKKSSSASAPSCLVAYGIQNVISLYSSEIKGTIIEIKNTLTK